MTDAQQREAARQFFYKWSNKGREDEDARSYWIDILVNILDVDHVTDRVDFEKKVVGPDGGRVSFLRATGRYFAREFCSGCLTMGFGYFLVPFDDRRRALHDRMAGTLVVARTTPPAAVAALNGRTAPRA